ncbi:MAG: NADP-dependent oxidoreductase [Rhabdochlamydiaceae bacterium]|nr:NADP-dependent oxidoreductase [Rhabdochlamydiaceae bacterium]
MKALAMTGFGSSDTFRLIDTQVPIPQENQVRIRIKAAGFNPVDWKIREGWYKDYGSDDKQILGCDCSGIIDAVGPHVKEFNVGDEVYAMTFLRSSNGSYAEYSCVPIELVYKKPSHLTFEEAAAVPLAAMTALRATSAGIPFRKEDAVLIVGVGGGVGSFAIQCIQGAGVEKIFTVAKNESSADYLVKHLGIPRSHIVLYQGVSFEELKKQLLALNGGRFFNATIDLVGKEMKKLCLDLTGYSGHFSTIVPEKDFNYPTWNENATPRMRNASLLQVMVGAELASLDRSDWKIYQQHFKQISNLKVPHIQVVGSLSVQTVQKAHALLEDGSVKGKLVMII